MDVLTDIAECSTISLLLVLLLLSPWNVTAGDVVTLPLSRHSSREVAFKEPDSHALVRPATSVT